MKPTYPNRTTLHRFDQAQRLTGEIRRLRGTGLNPSDIARRLKVDLAVVLRVLRADVLYREDQT